MFCLGRFGVDFGADSAHSTRIRCGEGGIICNGQ